MSECTINKKTGRPPMWYTDEQWQSDFLKLKEIISQSPFQKMSKTRGNIPFLREYYGKTQYECYCDFINDILSTIRHGKEDYCFCVYQISDLLKFEHDKLQAEWLSDYRCFKLSLKIR